MHPKSGRNLEWLKGKLVQLRAVEPSDVDFLLALENDPLGWTAGNTLVPFSRHQIEQYVLTFQHDIFAEHQLRLMIETVHGDIPPITVGTIDLYDYDPHHHRAAVGIMILREERGKGFAAEALGLLIEYAFNILNLHQLYCGISTKNKKSLRLFQKQGFVRCGVKKEWRYEGGNWVDEIQLQLLNSLNDGKKES
jgi:diamine N-acetyltransferase